MALTVNLSGIFRHGLTIYRTVPTSNDLEKESI